MDEKFAVVALNNNWFEGTSKYIFGINGFSLNLGDLVLVETAFEMQ